MYVYPVILEYMWVRARAHVVSSKPQKTVTPIAVHPISMSAYLDDL